jgi:hypothetical protein
MTPDEESCFRNLITCAEDLLEALKVPCEGKLGEEYRLEAALKACTQARTQAAIADHRAAQTEAPAPAVDEDTMRKHIEMLGNAHLTKLSPPNVIPTTGQYIEALTVALCPVLVESDTRLTELEKDERARASVHIAGIARRLTELEIGRVTRLEGVPQGMDARITALAGKHTALDGEIGLFAARIHSRVEALEKRLAEFDGIGLFAQRTDDRVAKLKERVSTLEDFEASVVDVAERATKLEELTAHLRDTQPEQPARFAPPGATHELGGADIPERPFVPYTKAEIDLAKDNPIMSAERMAELAKEAAKAADNQDMFEAGETEEDGRHE